MITNKTSNNPLIIGTVSSTQEAMIENAPENEISSYENYLKRKRNSLSGDILKV